MNAHLIWRLPLIGFFGNMSAILFTDPTPRNLLMAIPAGLLSCYLLYLCFRRPR